MLSEYDQGFSDGVAATRALLAAEQSVIEFGPLTFSRTERQARFHGKPIRLTETHRLLLEQLMNGRLLTFEHAIAVLWPLGETSVDVKKLINVHIHKLRHALIEQGVPQAIVTRWGQGYRLDLQTLKDAPAPVAARDQSPIPASNGQVAPADVLSCKHAARQHVARQQPARHQLARQHQLAR